MVSVWDYLMRRKGFFGLILLLFAASALLSGLFLYGPDILSNISNTNTTTEQQSVVSPEPVVNVASPRIVVELSARTVDEPELAETIAVPRTGGYYTAPGTFIDFDALNALPLQQKTAAVASLKSWQSIVATTTGVLIFAVVVIVFARYLC